MISSPGCGTDTKRWATASFSWLHLNKKGHQQKIFWPPVCNKRFSFWIVSDSMCLARTCLNYTTVYGIFYVWYMFWCTLFSVINLTFDLKKRITWAMSKFWSAQSMSPAICLHKKKLLIAPQFSSNRIHPVNTMKCNQLHDQTDNGQIHRTTMMSSCSLRLRMASCRSATAPRRSSNVVLPSFTTFSTGKSLAVAQRS